MNKSESARELARRHFQVEAGRSQIFRVTGEAGVEATHAEPIKLPEVNENTSASGIMPLFFGPAPASGISFPSVIVEVTPEEFKKNQTLEIKLPLGWDNWEEVPRPSDMGIAL